MALAQGGLQLAADLASLVCLQSQCLIGIEEGFAVFAVLVSNELKAILDPLCRGDIVVNVLAVSELLAPCDIAKRKDRAKRFGSDLFEMSVRKLGIHIFSAVALSQRSCKCGKTRLAVSQDFRRLIGRRERSESVPLFMPDHLAGRCFGQVFA